MLNKRMAEAKTSQAVLEQCRYDYVIGNWKSIGELGEKYSIHPKTLQARIVREKWEEERRAKLSEIESHVQETKENLVEKYLKKSFLRAEKYEKMIDASQRKLNLGKDEEGNLILPAESLNTFTLIEARIHEMAKSALRIPDHKSVDITSKGQSIGESIFSALEKIRANDKTPELTEADCDRILECEVIDEKDKL